MQDKIVGRVKRVNGPVLIVKGITDAQMMELVHVSDMGIVGEIVKLNEGEATIQVYEDATGISGYVVDAFFGNIAGCIGEVSALLLLLGGIFLIVTHIITWHVPVIYIGSFALLSWIFGGLPRGLGLFQGEVLLPILTGGLILGAFFMATDWVTSPTSRKGQVIYAIGCGFFTFLIRYFASLPEGVSIAILLMNIVTPTIDRYIRPKKFGYVKPEKKKKGVEA